ncbi:MAG: 50S ribosomal protein L13 [Candidatus Micrarchaeaceae archaeon]
MTEYSIDGEGVILGRLASKSAKLLLEGNQVNIFNAEKVVMSGHLKDIISKYKVKVELKDKANPEHSPYISRRPDLFVKRVVRGMLPYRQPKGKNAYKNLKVYTGMPEGMTATSDIQIKKGEEVYENLITIKTISEKLGYK